MIYILGSAYSGSTILGFILGSAPEIFNAGELSYLNSSSIYKKICTCGQLTKKCEFWSQVKCLQDSDFREISLIRKLGLTLEIIFGMKLYKRKTTEKCDKELYFSIKDVLDNMDKNNKFILDNSKSLWRLIHLSNCDGIQIKIIYIKKDIFRNVSSFIKHKKGFMSGILLYKVYNFLMARYLKLNKKDYMEIKYSKLCNDTNNELDRIGKFLDGVDFTDYLKLINKRHYHVPTGNVETRKQITKNFKGLKLDNSWKTRLSIFQKKFLNVVK